MEKLPLISVIVPVYRVEAYLDKCISSIIEQTYSNLEIILVDDGSPDFCGAMCDTWALRDSRIRVVHKDNGGLSDARNSGLTIASGELIGFVDSDDFIRADMYQLLYENMIETGSDISACGVEMVWEDGKPPKMMTKTGSAVLDSQSAMEAIIRETWLKQPVWYKLYKAELIQNIAFPVGKYHEDVFWSYQAVGLAKRVAIFDTPCYFYTQRNDSIMGKSFSLKRLDALEAKILRLQYIQHYFPELLSLAKCELSFFCLWSAQITLKYMYGAEKRKSLKIIKQAQKEVYDAVSEDKKARVWLTLSRISLEATAWLRNFLRIGI